VGARPSTDHHRHPMGHAHDVTLETAGPVDFHPPLDTEPSVLYLRSRESGSGGFGSAGNRLYRPYFASFSSIRAFTIFLTRAGGGGLPIGNRIVPFATSYRLSSSAKRSTTAGLAGKRLQCSLERGVVRKRMAVQVEARHPVADLLDGTRRGASHRGPDLLERGSSVLREIGEISIDAGRLLHRPPSEGNLVSPRLDDQRASHPRP
jgi:hypothetical protein